MSFSTLPPVGNRIALFGNGELPVFSSYSPVWLDSGTSALALALILIRERSTGISDPQVLVPAYGCPDLIAAAKYAKVEPVLVDICPDDPSFDLEELKAKINHRTVAVLAVNFLGIRERLNDIKAMLPAHTYLLEDNAQWYPEFGDKNLVGDYVITSFGRGKPASVLGGGLLLVNKTLPGQEADYTKYLELDNNEGSKLPVSTILKIWIYNILLIPYLYYWLLKLPFIQIGKTIFKPLNAIREMPKWRKKLLGINLQRYLKETNTSLVKQYEKLFSTHPDFSLVASSNDERNVKKLRFPILCRDRKLRDKYFERFQNSGLGVTKMYQIPLLEIDGVNEFIESDTDCMNASVFAQRLITFPVHQGVNNQHIVKLAKLLEDRCK